MNDSVVNDEMPESNPSGAGLYENAIGVSVTATFGVTAYSADSAARTSNVVSAPEASAPFIVNGLSGLVSPLNSCTPTPTSARTLILGATSSIGAAFASRPITLPVPLSGVPIAGDVVYGTGVNVNAAPTSRRSFSPSDSGYPPASTAAN